MKTLNLEQMENVQGGALSERQCKALNIAVYVAGIGCFGGLPGALMFGPIAVIGGAVALAAC